MPEVKMVALAKKDTQQKRTWVRPPKLPKQLQEQLMGDGPFDVKLVEKKSKYKWGLLFPDMKDEVMKLVRKNDPKDRIWIRNEKKRIWVVTIGAWHTERVPPPPPGISPSISRAHGITYAEAERLEVEFKEELRIVTMGYTVCKIISGTNVPSQHCPGPPSPTGGNAMDWVVVRANGDVHIAATDKVVAKLEASGYPEALWRGIPGHYPGHAHTTGNPKRSGWPVCL